MKAEAEEQLLVAVELYSGDKQYLSRFEEERVVDRQKPLLSNDTQMRGEKAC